MAHLASIHSCGRPFAAYITNYIKTKEIAFLQLFDSIITFSNEDAKKLTDQGLKNIFVSPFAIAIENFKVIEGIFELKKLIFLGPELHVANKDGLTWYAENISERVFQTYNLNTYVIGNWSDAFVKSLEKYPSIKFLGYVKDINEITKDSAMIVPLRIGSGIRTKVMEAFASGIPVISTSIGIEGIEANCNEHFYLANNEDSFLQAIQSILFDNKTDIIIKNASTLSKEKFSIKSVYENRMIIYNKICS